MKSDRMNRIVESTGELFQSPEYAQTGFVEWGRYSDLLEAYGRLMQGAFADRMIRFIQQDSTWVRFVSERIEKGQGQLWSQLHIIGRANQWHRGPMRRRLVTMIQSLENPERGIAYLREALEIHPIVVALRNPSDCDMVPGIDISVINEQHEELAQADSFENQLLHMFVIHFAFQSNPLAALEVIEEWLEYVDNRAEIEEQLSVGEQRVSAISDEAARIISESKHELKILRKSENQLQNQLEHARDTISAKDRKITSYQKEVNRLESVIDELQVQINLLKEDSAEKGREIKRQKELVKQERKGRIKATSNRDEAARSYEELDSELHDLNDYATDLEDELVFTKKLLEEEAARRQDIETTLDAFGFDSLASSVQEMDAALGLFGKIRDAIAQVADTREQERQDALRAAEEEALEEYEARILQNRVEERNHAIRQHYLNKMEDFESSFVDGSAPDSILIDGHNLLHQVNRPDSEPSTRKWLVKLIEEFTSRLQSKGSSPRIDLVFDSPHDTNTEPHVPLLYVTYAKRTSSANDGSTGADAFIIESLSSVHPDSHVVIISSDRRHIWAEAEALETQGGPKADCMESQLMAEYLSNMQMYFNECEQNM